MNPNTRLSNTTVTDEVLNFGFITLAIVVSPLMLDASCFVVKNIVLNVVHMNLVVVGLLDICTS